MSAQPSKPSKKTRGKGWERRLGPYLDWATYFICGTLIFLIVWLATTREQVRVSFTGTSSQVLCDLGPLAAISGEAEPIEYPHLHATADALIATGTTLRFEVEGDGASGTRVFIPKSPQATALIKFSDQYTVRLFMHKGNTLGLLPGGDVPLDSMKPWVSLGMPKEYALAFQFRYRPDTLLWRVVGVEEARLTLTTLGFDQDGIFVKPVGKHMEISGLPRPFEDVPIVLGCCSSDWPPLAGQLVTFGPGGQKANYVPMLFVNVRSEPNAELVEAEPLMCESVSVGDALGAVSLDGKGQSLDSPVSVNFKGSLEVRPASDHRAVKYVIPGSANSVIIGGHELVQTRLNTIGSFWAALLGTIAASFLVALIVTKGRMIQQWLKE